MTTVIEFIDSLVQHAVQVLVEAGMTREDSAAAGNAIARRICEQYGKTVLYVPAPSSWIRADRDDQIRRQYDEPGPNGARPRTHARVHQLASKHGLTVQYVYRILRRSPGIK